MSIHASFLLSLLTYCPSAPELYVRCTVFARSALLFALNTTCFLFARSHVAARLNAVHNRYVVFRAS